jgi:hypothetical protein
MRPMPVFVLALLVLGCSNFTRKPAPMVAHGDMDALRGAVIVTLVAKGYEIDSVTDQGIATKKRHSGSRGELEWDVVVRPAAGGVVVDTNAVNAEGEVHERVARWMAEVKTAIEQTLQQRPVEDLVKVSRGFGTKVMVSNALPGGPCTPLGTVSATAPGMNAGEGVEAARRMLEIEGLIKQANFVVIETNNMVPMGFTVGTTLTGTAYSCQGPG